MAVGSKVGEAYIELSAKMAKFEAQLRSAKMLTGKATAKMQTGMNNVAAATKGTSAAMKLLKVAIGAISFIAIAMAFKKIVQATAQFEDAQLELRKTSGMTREEIDKFSNRMKNMAATMPTSTTGLLEIAAAAARLGIKGSDNLSAFSETVIKMATATQYTEEQASLDFAKIANVMKLPYSEIGRLGSAMNELANTTTATAPIIGDFTRRVAGAGLTLGLTIPQLTAMGATLDSLGVRTEVAGTAMSNFFTKMLTKAATFADQAGMKIEEWNHLVEVDAWEALQKWLSAMDKMKPIERAQALGELKMAGARMTDTLMKLSGAQEKLNVNLAISQKAFEENTSLEKEYQIALEGLSAQWNIFTGNVVNLAITIGTKLSPALKQIMKGLNVVVDGLQFMIRNWTQVWQAAYQILVETFKQMGKIIWKFFTNKEAFVAGLRLIGEFYKAWYMSLYHTGKLLATLYKRIYSIMWAPLIKSLQWVVDNIKYYFALGIEKARNAIIKGVNWITSKVFTPMANFFIDVANKMTEGAQAFVNFFIDGMNLVVKAIKPVISAFSWFAEHILRKELPDSIKEFGEIAEVEFKKIEKLGEDALTIEIPESTLKQPAKFTARMSEAWAIIKEQYSKIPGDLRKYVDDLAMEWENVTKAAGEFGKVVDWSDYKARLAEIIKKLKEAGVDTSALEKEQEKLNEEIEKGKSVINKNAKAVTNLLGAYEPMPRIFKEIKTGISDMGNSLASIGVIIIAGLPDLFTWAGKWEGMPRIFKEIKIGASEMINSLAGVGAIIVKGLPKLFQWSDLWEGMPRIFKDVKIGLSKMENSLASVGSVITKGLPKLFIWEGLWEGMPRIFKEVKIGASTMKNSLAGIGTIIAEGLPDLFTWSGIWEGMPRIFKKVEIGASKLANSLASLGAIIAKGLPKLFKWKGLLEPMPRIYKEVETGTSEFENSLASLGGTTAKGLPLYAQLNEEFQGMPLHLGKVTTAAAYCSASIANLGQVIYNTMQDGIQIMKTAADEMDRVWKRLTRDIKSAFLEFSSTILTTTTKIGEAFKTLAQTIYTSLVQGALEALCKKFAKDLVEAIAGSEAAAKKASEAMKAFAQGAAGGIVAMIAVIISAILEMVSVNENAMEICQGAWNAWANAIAATAEQIRSAMNAMAEYVGRISSSMAKLIGQTGEIFEFTRLLEIEFRRVGLAISQSLEEAQYKLEGLYQSQVDLASSTREKLINELDKYYDYRMLREMSLDELLALSAETRGKIERGEIAETEASEAEKAAKDKDRAISRLEQIENQYAREDELLRRKIALTEIEIKMLEWKMEIEEHGHTARSRQMKEELDQMLKNYKESVEAYEDAEKRKQKAAKETAKTTEEAAEDMSDSMEDAGEDIEDSMDDAAESIEKAAEDMVVAIERATKNLATAIENMASGIVTAIENMADAIVLAIENMVNKINAKLEEIPEEIRFDIIGDLHMPEIPSIGARYFDIFGTYHAPSIPTAQIGIPYIPRTMPIIVHKKEAVLTAPQAREWRAGKGGDVGGNTFNIRILYTGDIRSDMDEERFMNKLTNRITEKMRRS